MLPKNVGKKVKKKFKNKPQKQNCGQEAKIPDYVPVTNQWVLLKKHFSHYFFSSGCNNTTQISFPGADFFYVTMFYTDSSSLCLNYLREQIAAKCTSDGPSPASTVLLA